MLEFISCPNDYGSVCGDDGGSPLKVVLRLVPVVRWPFFHFPGGGRGYLRNQHYINRLALNKANREGGKGEVKHSRWNFLFVGFALFLGSAKNSSELNARNFLFILLIIFSLCRGLLSPHPQPKPRGEKKLSNCFSFENERLALKGEGLCVIKRKHSFWWKIRSLVGKTARVGKSAFVRVLAISGCLYAIISGRQKLQTALKCWKNVLLLYSFKERFSFLNITLQ